MGHAEMARLREHLSSSKAAKTARLLQHLNASRESVEAVLDCDALWCNVALGWRYRLERAVVFDLRGLKPVTPQGNLIDGIELRSRTMTDLLAVDLALRAYRADHGTWPQSLNELAPEYVDAVPLDPYSRRPFIYRIDESNFVLYSVGHGGEDDGGQFTNMQTYGIGKPGRDLDVDTLIRP